MLRSLQRPAAVNFNVFQHHTARHIEVLLFVRRRPAAPPA
jgi:hypothetical protein